MRASPASAPPRLLIVGAFPPPHRRVIGGIVTCCKELMGSSLPQRAELVLVDSTQATQPPPPLAVRMLVSARRFVRYIAAFERARPSAVLLFVAMGASALEKGAMAWYARLRGTPAVLLPRCEPPQGDPAVRWRRALHAFCYRGAARIICQGSAWQRFAVDALGLREADAPVIRNWTATPALLALGRGKAARPPERPVRLLFVGWVEREKGIFELVEAARRLAATHRFELAVVGDGTVRPHAEAMAAQHGLASAVRFLGWLDRDGVAAQLAAADVFVLPSWKEGLPNSMIEAMCARLAVVVSGVGNIPDTVTDGEDALVVPPHDPAALAAALARVIDDAALRERLAANGFRLAEREFGLENAVQGILDTVRDCAAAPAATAPGTPR
ncbi:MAG TPA: glycosyltransferase family 4 protein [Albitalea sp.]